MPTSWARVGLLNMKSKCLSPICDTCWHDLPSGTSFTVAAKRTAGSCCLCGASLDCCYYIKSADAMDLKRLRILGKGALLNSMEQAQGEKMPQFVALRSISGWHIYDRTKPDNPPLAILQSEEAARCAVDALNRGVAESIDEKGWWS